MLSAATIIPDEIAFTDHERSVGALGEAAAGSGGDVRAVSYGKSEGGRALVAYFMGKGAATASLCAGAHADEPVGPETLRTLVAAVCADPTRFEDLLARYSLVVVPHVNPDGEARNRKWIEAWPEPSAYIREVVREAPGRDMEFGYPDLRPENRALSVLWRESAPFRFHASLHGMGFSDGAMILLERHWAFRSQALRDNFTVRATDAGLRLHDHNRKGEKGFFQIEPGYTTTPEGAAMRAFFESKGDDSTAGLFRDSSMEFIRSLGGDPFCLVTELPLFVVDGPARPGVPEGYLQFKDRLPGIRAALEAGRESTDLAASPLSPLPLRTAMTLQIDALDLGLRLAVGLLR